jgi:hypothetical protein
MVPGTHDLDGEHCSATADVANGRMTLLQLLQQRLDRRLDGPARSPASSSSIHPDGAEAPAQGNRVAP